MPGHDVDAALLRDPVAADELRCPQCHMIMKDAVKTRCGHCLCKTCLADLMLSKSRSCPTAECRVDIVRDNEGSVPDINVRAAVMKLRVRCPFHGIDCTWQGKLRQLDTHIRTRHTLVKCQSCSKRVPAADLELHSSQCNTLLHLQNVSKRLARYELSDLVKDSEIVQLREKIKSLELESPNSPINRGDLTSTVSDMSDRITILENTSTDGTFVWPINKLKQRMLESKAGKCGSLFSIPFYTNRYGYRLCLRMYLDGDGMGNGTHVSLLVVVMRGDYDAMLTWPFPKQMRLTIVNQKDRAKDVSDVFMPDAKSSSFQRPKADMNVAYGVPMFMAHSNLDNGFVVDDLMMVSCEVGDARLPPA